MTFGELFAGISGFGLGLERAGHHCAWQCELDPFCARILAERWPGVRRFGDVRGVGAGLVGRARADAAGRGGEPTFAPEHVDLLVGGFPCQGASVAGKRLGLADDRTALFWEIIRVQKIIRAPWALLENVPGLRSVRFGHDFATCLAALKELWPVVGWRTFDSRFFNVAQRRERVFFVCGPTEEGVASVLFEPEGGVGHLAAGGEAGAGVAGPLGGGAYGAGRRDEDDPNLIVDTTQITSAGNYSHPKPGDPCHPLAEGAHPPLLIAAQCHGSNVGPMGALRGGNGNETGGVPFVTHALSAEGADASEDGTGRGTPLTIAPTLNGYHGRNQLEGQYHATGSLVRRLTPLECERLQAFPDGWTCLCQPLSAYAADPDAAMLACTCPDSPRYRALGNAVTVSVIEWIGRRLAAQEGRTC